VNTDRSLILSRLAGSADVIGWLELVRFRRDDENLLLLVQPFDMSGERDAAVVDGSLHARWLSWKSSCATAKNSARRIGQLDLSKDRSPISLVASRPQEEWLLLRGACSGCR